MECEACKGYWQALREAALMPNVTFADRVARVRAANAGIDATVGKMDPACYGCRLRLAAADRTFEFAAEGLP